MFTLGSMELEESGVSAVVLGTMQDGGLPHIGCSCFRCHAAYENPLLARFAASLALIDRRGQRTAVWIIDATPDIKWQLAMLSTELGADPLRFDRLRQPDGLFLTHAHMGHIGGIPQLGPEAMAVSDLPVYALPGLLTLLQGTTLWHPVNSRLSPEPLFPGKPLALAPELTVTAIAVPHRDEWGIGTVAYRIEGPQRTLFYCPDIDDWDLWPEASANLDGVDVAMVDATFYGPHELGGRMPVAHPPVPDTLARFASISGQLVLTHINHTNPILDDGSSEQQSVFQAGAHIASRGLAFDL